MRAGTFFRYTEMDRTGQPVITNELHTATLLAGLDNTFTLNSPGADQSSIVITVTTVVPPGDLPVFVELQQGLDYTVVPTGNTFLITILSVPLEVCQTAACLDPAFIYTFRVTYESFQRSEA
jgi:hypothetical protein